ncbi:MAG: ester cyclase [Ginsengibacter sp.]
MKQIFFMVFAVLLCISCNNNPLSMTGDTGKDSTVQKNLEAFDAVIQTFQTGDASKIDNVVAADFVDHTESGDKGRDSLKAEIVMMHDKFPNMKTEVINETAGDDYVYGWMRYSGTSDGGMGMPKGPFNMTGIELVKFKDGKATEHWYFMQPQDMMNMMGPQPGMEPKDSTK